MRESGRERGETRTYTHEEVMAAPDLLPWLKPVPLPLRIHSMKVTALNIADLVECALSMPRSERSFLVSKLIGSLDDDDTEVSPEWRDELNRRVEEMRDGTYPGIPHEDVMNGARELLASIRKEKQAA